MTLRRRLLVIAALLVVALSGLVVAGIGTATARSDAADDDRALTLASEQALRLASGYVDMPVPPEISEAWTDGRPSSVWLR